MEGQRQPTLKRPMDFNPDLSDLYRTQEIKIKGTEEMTENIFD